MSPRSPEGRTYVVDERVRLGTTVRRTRSRHWGRTLRVLGILLVALGVGLCALLVWELWGTGISTARVQAQLRQQLNGELQDDTVIGNKSHPGIQPDAVPLLGQPIATIRIPKIHLDMVVVEGTTPSELAKGPGHYVGTAYPWHSRGRVGIAGHRTTYLHPFWSLDQLRDGDRIFLQTKFGRYTYVVTGSRTVLPQETWVLDESRAPTLVLTTCSPRYSASHRLVVFARRADASRPRGSVAALSEAGVHPVPDRLLLADPGGLGWLQVALFCSGVAIIGLVFSVLLSRTRHRRVARRTLMPVKPPLATSDWAGEG